LKHHNDTLHALSRGLDGVWWLTARLLRLDDLGRSIRMPASILIVDLHLLGDIVMLVPLLRVIRRYHPNAHLGLMAGPWARTILEESGLVDEFITLQAPWICKDYGRAAIRGLVSALRAARSRTWDWGIDVRGDTRNSMLLALAQAKRRVAYTFAGGAALLTDVVPDDGVLRHIIDHHAGIAAQLGMEMTTAERVPTLAAPRVASQGPRRIGFHFGASMPLRRMPVEEARDLLLRFRAQKDICVILVDAPDVRDLNSAVIQCLPAAFASRIERWQGSLSDLIEFLKGLDRFHAMDSGPAHLAAALGVATVVFFGPHLSHAVRPTGRQVTIIERDDVPCRPCGQRRCTNPRYQECLTNVVRLLPYPPTEVAAARAPSLTMRAAASRSRET
jgi:ADP-heptose:LPS heptosyltransferase